MTAETSTQDLLPAELTMGTVMLKVGDMKLMTDYYQRALGLDIVAEQDGGLYLGRRQKPLVHLAPAPGLNVPSRGEAGLFHTALLFEDQPSLAATVASAAQYEPQSFSGSADHLVSEAFYFNDPEGNGIELYWDRPREAWSWDGKNVVMDSLALPPQRYLEQYLTEESVRRAAEAAAGVGHVHLQVGDVQSAQDFYVGTLGFEKTAGWHGQALFVSAGGYHHHMAMNVWNSRGAGPRRDTLGLGEVLIEVPSGDDVGALADRLRSPVSLPPHRRGAALRGPVAQPDPRRRPLKCAVRGLAPLLDMICAMWLPQGSHVHVHGHGGGQGMSMVAGEGVRGMRSMSSGRLGRHVHGDRMGAGPGEHVHSWRRGRWACPVLRPGMGMLALCPVVTVRGGHVRGRRALKRLG